MDNTPKSSKSKNRTIFTNYNQASLIDKDKTPVMSNVKKQKYKQDTIIPQSPIRLQEYTQINKQYDKKYNNECDFGCKIL